MPLRAKPTATGPHCDMEPSAEVNFCLFGRRHGVVAQQSHPKDGTMTIRAGSRRRQPHACAMTTIFDSFAAFNWRPDVIYDFS